jgi:hypothetical protein
VHFVDNPEQSRFAKSGIFRLLRGYPPDAARFVLVLQAGHELYADEAGFGGGGVGGS